MSSEKTLLKQLNEKIGVLSHEVTYLHELVKYQDSKLDRLTTLLEEVLENHAIELTEATRDDSHVQRSSISDLVNPGNKKEESTIKSIELSRELASVDPQEMSNTSVAAAAVAVAAAGNNKTVQENNRVLQDGVAAMDVDKQMLRSTPGPIRSATRKEARKVAPSIKIVFLNNPETVQEIFDEFTKGILGQPPLCELDARFGKHYWRGDSRSKELKRFQRRRNLCDAIYRGVQKYGKSAEEIIEYIESFRGTRLLTWVMNGNYPADLLEPGDHVSLN